MNTCSGCHGGETQTFFTHVDPAGFGSEAGLSGFLTGSPGRGIPGFLPVDLDGDTNNGVMTVSDPAGNARDGNNPGLAEFQDLVRREADLNELLSTTCSPLRTVGVFKGLTFKPLAEPH